MLGMKIHTHKELEKRHKIPEGHVIVDSKDLKSLHEQCELLEALTDTTLRQAVTTHFYLEKEYDIAIEEENELGEAEIIGKLDLLVEIINHISPGHQSYMDTKEKYMET